MRIGRLDTRVWLQQPTATPDGQGGEVVTWTTVAEVWAAFGQAKGQEIVDVAVRRAIAPAIVTIYYRTDLDTTWRIVRAEDGKIFEVLASREIPPRRMYLELDVVALP